MASPLEAIPARYAAAVTPSDTTVLHSVAALWVGGAGNVAIVDQGDTTTTITGVPAGTILPIAAKKVNSTNTTATSIVAFKY